MKKQFSQKQRGIFIALVSFLCVMSVKAQTWTAPVPVGSVMTTGSQYYVYSVGAKAFIDRGGQYDSQAIVTPSTGSVITTVASSSLWILQFETSAKCLKHDVGSGWTFTDGNVNNTWDVQVTDVANNVYSLQVPTSFTPDYNVNQFLGTSSTLYSSNNEGTVYDVRYNRTASDYTKWLFVTAADLAKFNAQVKLDKYMNIAKYVGSSVNLTSYISTYTTGTTSEINTAVTNLKAALTMIDKTSSINNAGFSSAPNVGWTTANYGYTNSVCEFWRKNNASLSQTINNLPAGLYVVKAQGFQRPVDLLNTGERAKYTNGSDILASKLYVTTTASDTTFIPLRSIYSETTCPAGTVVDTYKFPNSTGDARAAFDASSASLYENELDYVIVDGTGSLTLGANIYYQPASTSPYVGKDGDWNVVDNFRLYYYGGLPVPASSDEFAALNTSIGTASGLYTSTSSNEGNLPGQYPAANRSTLSAAIATAQAVHNNSGATSIVVNAAKSTLDAVITTFNSSVVPAAGSQAEFDALAASIATAQGYYTGSASNEGSSVGQYTATNRTTLANTISAAQAVHDYQYSSSAQLTSSKISVDAEVTTFINSINIATNQLADGDYFIVLGGKYVSDPGVGTIADGVDPKTTNEGLQSQINIADGTQIFKIAKLSGFDRTTVISRYSFFNAKTSRNLTENAVLKSTWAGPAAVGGDDPWRTQNIYYNGTNYAIQAAGSSASKGMWYFKSDNELTYNSIVRTPIAADYVFTLITVSTVYSEQVALGRTAFNAAVKGTQIGNYSETVYNTFKSALESAEAIVAAGTATNDDLYAYSAAFQLFIPRDVSTGVNPSLSSSSVYVANKTLIVNGSQSIEVFTAQGMRVAQSKANGESYSVALKPGVYIVKLDAGVKKVVVK